MGILNSLFGKKPEVSPADRVVPRIVLISAKTANPCGSHDELPVERTLYADLVLWYAFEEDLCFKILAQRDLRRLALDKQLLHDIALKNLRRTIPPPDLQEISTGVFLVTCGGNFEATTLLLEEVWERASTMVQGDLVVAVPASDIVILTGTENREGLAFMRSKASDILETGRHVLTQSFLVRHGTRWSPYEGFCSALFPKDTAKRETAPSIGDRADIEKSSVPELLTQSEFRCFGCGGVIGEHDKACSQCGWTWK